MTLTLGVFGHALSAGLGTPLAGISYVNFLAPGVLVITAGFAAEATTVHV